MGLSYILKCKKLMDNGQWYDENGNVREFVIEKLIKHKLFWVQRWVNIEAMKLEVCMLCPY